MRPPIVPTHFNIPAISLYTDRFTKVYEIIKNLHGLKDAGRICNHHLRDSLVKCGWKQHLVNECLYIKQGLLLILYVDDACIISSSKYKIQIEIASLQEDDDLTDDGELQVYIRTRFDRHLDGSVTLTQPCMIHRLLTIVKLDTTETYIKLHGTPATTILQDNSNAEPRCQK